MAISIEKAIERMSRDTRERMKDLSAAYKRTGRSEYLREMIEILKNWGADADEAQLRKTLHL